MTVFLSSLNIIKVTSGAITLSKLLAKNIGKWPDYDYLFFIFDCRINQQIKKDYNITFFNKD